MPRPPKSPMPRHLREDQLAWRKCEECENTHAIYRFWNKKYLCSAHAKQSFRLWLVALTMGAAFIAGIVLGMI